MPGVTPSLISGWPNLAVSAAMMKSAIIATSQPPPSAKPATAAIHGLRVAVTCSQPAKKLAEYMSAKPCACISLMSAPAAKAFSRAGQDQAALAVVGVVGGEGGDEVGQHLAVERIKACGRLSVTSVTAPRCSTRMVS